MVSTKRKSLKNIRYEKARLFSRQLEAEVELLIDKTIHASSDIAQSNLALAPIDESPMAEILHGIVTQMVEENVL